MENTKIGVSNKIIYSGLLVILAIVLPQLFHISSGFGPTFLPMHIPVLLAGFALGPIYGLAVGVFSPILSTSLTGMPLIFPILPIMILELGTYGLVSGLLSKYTKLPILFTLLITMLVGRCMYALSYYTIQFFFLPGIAEGISPINAAIVGLPGIVLQLIAIPIIITLLRKKK